MSGAVQAAEDTEVNTTHNTLPPWIVHFSATWFPLPGMTFPTVLKYFLSSVLHVNATRLRETSKVVSMHYLGGSSQEEHITSAKALAWPLLLEKLQRSWTVWKRGSERPSGGKQGQRCEEGSVQRVQMGP